jgi:hypothetical protein
LDRGGGESRLCDALQHRHHCPSLRWPETVGDGRHQASKRKSYEPTDKPKLNLGTPTR